MDGKKILFLLSLGMINACDSTGINNYSESMPSNVEILPKTDIHQMKFLKNYNRLYREADGALFSFGDEKQLRKSLSELKMLPIARQMISELPKHVGIGSTYFLRGDLSGGYVFDNGRVNIASHKISTETQDRVSGRLITAEVLFHELYHANQDAKGLILRKNASMFDIVISQRLIEAEAHAWTNLLHEIRKVSSNGTYCLSQNDIQRFMQKDLITDKQKEMIREGVGEINSRYCEYFKKTDATYCFQQSLIACHGNLEKASHHMVVKRMRYFLSNQEKDWTEDYHKQAFLVIKAVAQKGELSKNGEDKAYNNMLNYYTRIYGLSRQEMQEIPRTVNLVKGMQKIAQRLDAEKGWVEDKKICSQKNVKSQSIR